MGIKQTTLIGEAEPVLVKAGRLAALLKISEVTVNSYRQKGMPAIKRDGVWQYVVDDCRVWVKKHVADQIRGEAHGGTRPNAGRPRRSVASAVQELRQAAMQAERGPIQQDLRSSVSGGGGGGGGDQVKLPTTVEGIAEALAAGTLAGVDARTLQVGLAAAVNSQKIEMERGDLLHKDDVEEVWVSHIQTAKSILRGVAPRVSQAMRMQFGLKPDETAEVRRMVDEEIQNVMGMLSQSAGQPIVEGAEGESADGNSADGGEEEGEE